MIRQTMGERMRGAVVALMCLGLAIAGPSGARAQVDPSGDPPSRVGRLADVDGTVSFHTSDQDQWSPAVPNYPVTAGSSFWTEPGAHAALELGPAVVRLGSQTEFDVVMTSFGDKKLDVVKVVKNLTGASLMDAKKMVEGVPAKIKEKVSTLGADFVNSTPEEFDQFVKRELAVWAKVVKDVGIKID